MGPSPKDAAERSRAKVTRLFDEYQRARDGGRTPPIEELLEEAGPQKPDLEARIQVFEELEGLSAQIERATDHGRLPRTVGRFRILSTIGAGGLGRVFLAKDPKLDREVALKVLDRSLALREDRAWILNEARSLARLEHPGVVRVFEVGSADGCDFVAMEHLTGPSLAQVIDELRRHDAPPDSHARVIAESLRTIHARTKCLAQIAAALAYCHNRGVIHRDVKPQNVLFDGKGFPKLIDFGLAHQEDSDDAAGLQITQQLIGSAAYVAPEQIEHERTGADPRSDQFSFCTLSYELLALEHPFPGSSTTQTMQTIARSDPRALRRLAPAVSRDLERIVHHGLEREPDDRYPTVQALADDLRAVLDHRPISVAEPSGYRRLSLWVKRNRTRVVAGAAVVLLATALLVGGWITRTIRERNRIRGEVERLLGAQEDPFELFSTALELDHLQVDATALDRGFASAWLAPISGEVDTLVRAWSKRLGEAYAARTTPGDELAWGLLFEMDARLCPECPFNTEERDRGYVFLPEAELVGRRHTVLRMQNLTGRNQMTTVFRPVEIVPKPSPGAYRLRIWEEDADELLNEIDFVVAEVWGEPQTLRPRVPDEDLLEDAVLVERTELPLPDGESALLVPAYRVMNRLVTTGEFRHFLEASGYEPSELDRTRGDDEPVWTDLDSALAFATWSGGRLPGFAEIYQAARRDRIEIPDVPESEWINDLWWVDGTLNGARFKYSTYHDQVRLEDSFTQNTTRKRIPWTAGVGVGFRVAFSADDPELLQDVRPQGP